MDEIESFVSENVSETVWLRLRRLTSSQLVARMLESRGVDMPEGLIERKAVGVASAVRSALGYWGIQDGGLNAKLVSRYYALLQITIAEQIASLDNADDLASVQRHTENGHGLFALGSDELSFPSGYFIGCMKSGHYPAYAKSLGVNFGMFAQERRPRKLDKAEPGTLLSLANLLARVPELQQVVAEYIGSRPLALHVFHSSKNMAERANRAAAQPWGVPLPAQEGDEVTFLGFMSARQSPTVAEVEALELPLRNLTTMVGKPPLSPQEHVLAEFCHAQGTYWYDHVPVYKSGYCGSSVITPFWGSRDPLLLHLAILYAFSIVARYLPDRWHSIELGALDNVRVLLEHYLVIVDNVLPQLAVERLSKRRLQVHTPGSLFASL